MQPANADGIKLEVPRKLAELTDITQLLLWAGPAAAGRASHDGQTTHSPGQTLTSIWSCCILKVMHTIAHMDKDLRTHYFTDIQKQVFDRFYKFIHRDEQGQIYLGKDAHDEESVMLVNFEQGPRSLVTA